MPHVQVAAGTLWVAMQGTQQEDSPPVVLVHGAGGSHLDWPAALRRLPGCRVLALDLPGHGRSAPPGRESIGAYAASVSQLCTALDLGPAVIIGHSMGAAIGLTLALQAPDCVAGLVLVGAAARWRVPPALLAALQTDLERAYCLLAECLWGAGAPQSLRDQTVARLRAVDPAVLAADYHACHCFALKGTLGAIRAPALVLAGEADRLVPLAASRALAAGLPAGTFVGLPGAGHMLPLEQPLVMREALLEWLESEFRSMRE